MHLHTARKHLEGFLEALDIDTKQPNFAQTADRVVKMYYDELTQPEPEIVTFPSTYNQMIFLGNHRTFTRCPHHLERVELIAHVAYVPGVDGRHVTGLSKLARIVDYISSGLKLQEDITDQIADYLVAKLNPYGCGVQLEGRHMCMMARGVHTSGSVTTTSLRLGFHEPDVKQEFFFNIQNTGKE